MAKRFKRDSFEYERERVGNLVPMCAASVTQCAVCSECGIACSLQPSLDRDSLASESKEVTLCGAVAILLYASWQSSCHKVTENLFKHLTCTPAILRIPMENAGSYLPLPCFSPAIYRSRLRNILRKWHQFLRSSTAKLLCGDCGHNIFKSIHLVYWSHSKQFN